jgi:hypothetical protein
MFTGKKTPTANMLAFSVVDPNTDPDLAFKVNPDGSGSSSQYESRVLIPKIKEKTAKHFLKSFFDQKLKLIMPRPL